MLTRQSLFFPPESAESNSGPAIKPIALYCISEIYQAVNIPVIGTGGVLTGLDMAEMMMAGATIVGIGSALYYSGYGASPKS